MSNIKERIISVGIEEVERRGRHWSQNIYDHNEILLELLHIFTIHNEDWWYYDPFRLMCR